MAHICHYCRLASGRKYSNCPSCGGTLYPDDRSLDYLEAADFRILGKASIVAAAEKTGDNTATSAANSQDTLANLRNRYRQSQDEDPAPAPQPAENRTDGNNGGSDNFFGRYARGETWTSPRTLRESADPRPSGNNRSNDDNDNFFARYAGGNSQADSQNREQLQPRQETAPIPPESRRNRRRGSGFSGLGYILGNISNAIPWRAVFVLLIIGLVIAGVLVVWSLRYEILNSVLGFLVSLLPLVLIIAGIIWLFRSLFR